MSNILYLMYFKETSFFSGDFLKKNQKSNFVEALSVGDGLLHAD